MADLDIEMCNCFLDEASELLAAVEQCFLNLERVQNDPAMIDQILRFAHNLKGSAGAVGFDGLSKFTHKLESVILKLKNGDCRTNIEIMNLLLKCIDLLKEALGALRKNPYENFLHEAIEQRLKAIIDCDKCKKFRASGEFEASISACGYEQPRSPQELHLETISTPSFTSPSKQKNVSDGENSIRVSLDRIDKLMNNVGELVILQTGLSQTRTKFPSNAHVETISQMDKIIREVQDITISLRMIPLAQTFQKLKRIVRDTSLALGKDVDLIVTGEDIELDKGVLEQLSDPLVHLLRNAVDHGLESSEDRRKLRKPLKGQISLAAYHSSGRVIIEIKDDGRGLDPQKLIALAKDKDLLQPKEVLTDQQAYQLIFAPGFSTKDQATNISGRGVGMDVVKTNITALQGEIDIETTTGKGTSFKISLPLTLAIIEALVVRLGAERYVIPIVQVSETLQVEKNQISTVAESGAVLKLRDENIPIKPLGHLLGFTSTSHRFTETVGIIIRDPSAHCILVDQILGQQQIVVKKLGDEVHWLNGVMGAAILGDGNAVLILDLHELLQERRVNTKKRAI